MQTGNKKLQKVTSSSLHGWFTPIQIIFFLEKKIVLGRERHPPAFQTFFALIDDLDF